MAVKMLALCDRLLLPLGRFLELISLEGLVEPRAIVQLELLGQLRNR
jgi:hypothetical protein